MVNTVTRLRDQDLIADGHGSGIYIIAPPAFLGLIRSDLTKASRKLVEGTINKDLVKHSIDDIRSHLPKLL